MKHTNGPWNIIENIPKDRPYKAIIDSTKGYVADIECGGNGFCEQCQANARLIAAAPSLLEALKRCADVLPALDGFDSEDRKFLDSVKELIAQAEGKLL